MTSRLEQDEPSFQLHPFPPPSNPNSTTMYQEELWDHQFLESQQQQQQQQPLLTYHLPPTAIPTTQQQQQQSQHVQQQQEPQQNQRPCQQQHHHEHQQFQEQQNVSQNHQHHHHGRFLPSFVDHVGPTYFQQEDRARWTDPDRLKFLIQAYLGNVKEGKVTLFGLKKSQWNAIVSAFNLKFQLNHSVEQLKNGFGNLKRQFKDIQFLRELEGWGWDEKEKAVFHTAEAWNNVLKDFPLRGFSRLIGGRTESVWYSKSLELYRGMYHDLELICTGNSSLDDSLSFTELIEASGIEVSTLKRQTGSSRKRSARGGGVLTQSQDEPPKKIAKVNHEITDILNEIKSILREEQRVYPSPISSCVEAAILNLLPLRPRLGNNFGRALILLKEDSNATIFLNLDDEDRMNFLEALFQVSPPLSPKEQ